MYTLTCLPQSRERTLLLQNFPGPHCRQFACCPQVPGSQCDLISVPVVFTFLRMSCKWNHRICLHWFLSLSIKLLTFIRADACISSYSFFIAEQYLIVSIPSPVDGNLACFYLVEIENEAAINMHSYFFAWTGVHISEVAGSSGRCKLR